jgi:hypothetical protein
VLNAQRLTVTLNNVTDGNSTRSIVIPMNVLIGDSNSSGSVTATDIGQVKASSGQPLTAANFRLDLNASGGINATDISVVKAASGTSLPAAANDAPKLSAPE